MSQHQKLIELCEGNGFVCQAEFWKISKSPHKRRDEIAKGQYANGKKDHYAWEERRCEHGIPNSKDFRLVPGTMSAWPEPAAEKSPQPSLPTASPTSAPGSEPSSTAATSPSTSAGESSSDGSEPGTSTPMRLFRPSMQRSQTSPSSPGFADSMRQL